MGYQAMELLNNSFDKESEDDIIKRILVKSWIIKRGSEKMLIGEK